MTAKLQNPAKERLSSQRTQILACLLIFCTCTFVYLANNRTIETGDTVPASLIAFNWLFNHTLDLDAFRNSYIYGLSNVCLGCLDNTPQFFAEAPNGHLTSSYPIGNAIITFPLYLFFFIYLKLQSAAQLWDLGSSAVVPAVTDLAFDFYRQGYEKLAATLATALGVVIFYLCTSLKFNRTVAMIATFVYAFATNVWTTTSQALWQPTASNLVLLSILLCLLKANRSTGIKKRVLLLVAGIFCGLLPGIRPTNLLFSVAIILYSLFAYRSAAVFLLLGLPSILLSASWNFHYFGFSLKSVFVGGYSRFSRTSFFASFYSLTYEQFKQGFTGLLFNPNKGLIIFSPVVLFAIPGAYQAFKLRLGKDEQLIGCLTLAAFLIFLQYCFFTTWSGGWCYGPRYLVDTLAIVCFLIAYFLAFGLERLHQKKRWLFQGILVLFLTALLFSTFVQVVGAFGVNAAWDGVPYQVDRLWRWRDSQIERSTRSLYYQLVKPIAEPKQYVQKTDGVITRITDRKGQTIASPLTIKPAEELLIWAELTNTGKTQWFGYETGVKPGQVQVQVLFFDPVDQNILTAREGFLSVSGMPKPGESTRAIGSIIFPPKPGDYRMVFKLVVQGMGDFPADAQRPPTQLAVQVVQ